MQLSNEAVRAFFEQHIDRYYVQYSDLLSREQYDDSEQVYFTKDENAFLQGQWTAVTLTDDTALIEPEGDLSTLDEVIDFVVKKNKSLFLRMDEKTAIELASKRRICKMDKGEWEHHGVFGACKDIPEKHETDIIVRTATVEDAAYIQTLPMSEWGNLPVVMRFSRNFDQILLAEKDGELVGYLVYASSYNNYNDIVNVLTHPDKRGQGIGKALTAALIRLSSESGKLAYYGEAKTIASAALASAMRFEQLTPPKAVYTIM